MRVSDALFDMPAEVTAPEPAAPVVPSSSAVAVYPLVPARSFDAPFTYALPDAFAADVQVGSIVLVPVGKAARVGVVAELDVEPPPGVALKPVARIVDAGEIGPQQMP